MAVIDTHTLSPTSRLKQEQALFEEGYRFCLTMDLGDSDLQGALTRENVCPSPGQVHWEFVRDFVRDIASALQHLHGKGLIHGDVKPLNAVRVGKKWKLIDLDAAAATRVWACLRPPSSVRATCRPS